eukprot:5577517-Lingulodinium_polyedra.AAC.1
MQVARNDQRRVSRLAARRRDLACVCVGEFARLRVSLVALVLQPGVVRVSRAGCSVCARVCCVCALAFALRVCMRGPLRPAAFGSGCNAPSRRWAPLQ